MVSYVKISAAEFWSPMLVIALQIDREEDVKKFQ